MTHHDDDGIIGDRPKRALDLGPLFTQCDPAEAMATLERTIRPEPAPRATQETQAFAGGGPLTDAELELRRERIKDAVRQPLLDRAYLRRDLRERKSAGVTAADVRDIAKAKGLEGQLGTQQRAWSWLSPWLDSLAREGVLVKWQHDGQTMKRINEANGNDQAIYLHPYAALLKAVA